jgi:hypothetical protein
MNLQNNARPSFRFAPLILLVGDLIAIVVFVVIGQRDHNLVNEGNPVLGVLITTAEFAVPWAVAGWLLGAFPRSDKLTVRSLLTRSLNTWLVAAPIGILIRSFALGRDVIPMMFLVAALGFGGTFVLGWRAVFAVVWWWVGRKEVSPRPAPGS